jgi:RNA polymerase sigma-70 factor (ECF subfamily)
MSSSPRSFALVAAPPPRGAVPFDGRRPEVERDAVVAALFEAHFDATARVARNLGVGGADLDDVLQQVFLVAAARVHDLEPGKERAFLVQTTVRLAANLRRQLARRREVLGGDDLDPRDGAPTPEDLSDQRRALALLDRTLAAMDDDLRTVFVLYEIEEMTMAEIAGVLELPPGTVASRLRRAREDFQARLARAGRGAR